MRRRSIVVAVLTVSAFGSCLLARQGVVVTRDGNSFAGDVTQDDAAKSVTINIRGIPYKLKLANVDSITYTDEVDADVRQKLAALAPTDVKGRLALAQYADQHHAPATARDVLLDVQRIDPANPDARDQLERLRPQLRAAEPSTRAVAPPTSAPAVGAAAPPAPGTGSAPPVPVGPADARITRTVTPDEINFIRQSELRDGDNVRVKIDPELRRRFIEYTAMPAAEFNNLTTVQQAFMILDRGKPAMRREVRILSDPPAIAAYRRDVNRVLVTGCATSKCHGGSDPAKFRLFPQGDNEQAVYSNFVVLQKYTQSLRGRDRAMIDRQTPEESLLLAFMLPPELSDFPHPEAKGYRGAVRNRTDQRLTQILKWIRDDLTPVTPNYSRIDLSRPPSTQPAEADSGGRAAPPPASESPRRSGGPDVSR